MKTLKSNTKSFEKNSVIMFSIMMISNIVSYFTQIVLNYLSKDITEYGTSNTLISLFSILSVPGTCMILVVTRYIAGVASEEEHSLRKKLFSILGKCTLIFLLICFAISEPLCKILLLPNTVDLYILIIGAAISIVSAVFIGELQGKKDFVGYGIQGLISIVFRLLGFIFFLNVGLGNRGVAYSLLLGSAATVIYAAIRSKLPLVDKYNIKTNVKTSEILTYMLGIFLGQLFMSILVNGDLLLVRTFMGENIAGLYSSAMVLGKIPAYISGAIIAVLFPLTAEMQSKGRETISLLKKSLIYGCGLALIISLFIYIFGDFIIRILFKEEYIASKSYLIAVSVYIIPFIGLNILINFLNAAGETGFVILMLFVCCIASIAYSIVCHTSVLQIMLGVGTIISLTFIVNLVYYYCKKSKQGIFK